MIGEYAKRSVGSLGYFGGSPGLAGVFGRPVTRRCASRSRRCAEIARISQSPDTQAHGLDWQDVAWWDAMQEEFMREHGDFRQGRCQPGDDGQATAVKVAVAETIQSA